MAAKKKVGKKKVGKKKALAKTSRKSKALSTSRFSSELAAYASEESSKEKPLGVKRLSAKDGRFVFDENKFDEIDVIVVGSAFENSHYKSAWKEGESSPPACFAISLVDDDMVPHGNSPDKQNDDCATCEQNAWGSAPDGGKGKGCGNRRRLALINAEDEDYSDSEMVNFSVPPTSLANWKKYVKKVQKVLEYPPFAVVTRLSFDEDNSKVLCFDLVEPLDDDNIEIVMARRDEANTILLQPFDCSGYEEPESSGRRGKKKVGKKKVSKKKAVKKAGKKKAKSKFS